MIHKKHILIPVFLLCLYFSLAALEKTLIFGGDKGWPSFSRSENITKTAGRFGKEALCVAGAAAALHQDTDLLLNFEDGAFADQSGNYSILFSALEAVPDTIMGKYAALGKGGDKGLELKGNSRSIFGRTGPTGSFTLSFWLNPALAENGETVFSWRSSRNIEGDPVYQMIAAAFFNNKLEWTFSNLFSSSNKLKNLTLSGRNLIIPNTWAFHSLSFDEETGLLEYRVNGRTEALVYTTTSGRAFGNIFVPVLGVPAEIEICPAFTGKIDDFCIRKKHVESDYRLPLFNPEGGYFETLPIGPFPSGTRITAVRAITDTPAQTDIQFFIRAGNNYHTWEDNSPEWVPVKQGRPVQNIGGIWFQIAASLYTDGGGNKTPSVTEIAVAYTEKEAPLPPVRLFAQAGDGFIDLSWLASAGTSVSGYKIYYGEKSGEYLGHIAYEGRSPVDVGKKLSMRLSGLKTGKIYYFAVAAYEDSEPQLEGALSQEIYARPLKGKP